MAAPSPQTLCLYDSCVPALPDGVYDVTVSQTLAGPAAMTVVPADASLRFEVRGPRYALPAGDIHRVYPPASSVGRYHEDLPMVVFNRRSLPWEILLSGNPPAGTPWMALLVLTSDQLVSPTPPTPSGTRRMKLSALLAASSGVRVPRIQPLPGEDPTQIEVDVLELPVAQALALLPTLADATLLAHARVVSGGTSLEQGHDGNFSALIANRFAVPPPLSAGVHRRGNLAVVVSLEGFEDLLQGSPQLPAAVKTVRMISLASWTYTCVEDAKQNFSARMRHLEQDPDQTGRLLRPPSPDPRAPATVKDRLSRGYVAVTHNLRDGNQTFGWYRGPCVPELTQPIPTGETWPPRCAGDAMVLDSALGVFDQSYAVAWQTGRLLALSSQRFSGALLQWRRAAHAMVDLLVQRLPTGQGQPTPSGLRELTALLQPTLMSQRLTTFLSGELFAQISASIGTPGGYPAGGVTPSPLPAPTAVAPTTSQDLAQAMQSPEVQELLLHISGLTQDTGEAMHAAILPEQILRWLGKRALLQGVPIDQLVPDPRLLPQESIRFFAIDRNWVDALLEGALGVGLQSSRDSLFHQITRDPLKRAVDTLLAELRAEAIGEAQGATETVGTMGGFLLRSSVVTDYKGLEVLGWFLDSGGAPRSMRPLRYEQVSPGILLCIFPEVPVQVELEEPKQGLIFGVEDDGVHLRSIDPSSLGEATPQTLATDKLPTRSGDTLNVTGLAAQLARSLNTPSLGPAGLALQLLRRPEKKVFVFSSLNAPISEVSP